MVNQARFVVNSPTLYEQLSRQFRQKCTNLNCKCESACSDKRAALKFLAKIDTLPLKSFDNLARLRNAAG